MVYMWPPLMKVDYTVIPYHAYGDSVSLVAVDRHFLWWKGFFFVFVFCFFVFLLLFCFCFVFVLFLFCFLFVCLFFHLLPSFFRDVIFRIWDKRKKNIVLHTPGVNIGTVTWLLIVQTTHVICSCHQPFKWLSGPTLSFGNRYLFSLVWSILFTGTAIMEAFREAVIAYRMEAEKCTPQERAHNLVAHLADDVLVLWSQNSRYLQTTQRQWFNGNPAWETLVVRYVV